MRRTIDNDFELTGPIARGDRVTVDAHLAAIRDAAPDLEPMYRALAEVDRAMKIAPHGRATSRRTLAPLRTGPIDRPRADDGRAARGTRGAVSRRARQMRPRRGEHLRQSRAVRRSRRSRRVSARRSARRADRGERGRRRAVRAGARTRCTLPGDATWIDVEGAARGLEGDFRPGHFRGVATVCVKLFYDRRVRTLAFFGQKDAQQVAVVKQLVRDLNLDSRFDVVPTVRDADGLALSSRNARLSADERARALAIPRALRPALAGLSPRRRCRRRRPRALGDVEPEYVAVAVSTAQPTLAIAARSDRHA